MTYITTIDKAIPYHPFAKEFPPLDNAAFETFVADIETNGQREPITLYQGQILDGVHRYRACLRLKLKPRFVKFKGDDAAARAFVISRNVHRRHLKPKEKQAAIEALVKAMPEKSDRELGRMIKSDHKVIGRARRRLESTGAAPQLQKRVGGDGKARKQPAKKVQTDKASAEQARLKAVKEAMKQGEREKQEYIKKTIKEKAEPAKPAEPAVRDPIAPDEELTLLREFALFVIGRTRVNTDLPDHAEWKALLGKVKATLGLSDGD
jgi:ParB-like chromosome segregation protein Spo0J